MKKNPVERKPHTVSNAELAHYPLIVIAGCVNVGKSTLFNRLVEERKAVTSPIPGTTRDVAFGFAYWRDASFLVADTGGFIAKPDNEIDKQIFIQATRYLKKAHVVFFVVDVQAGLSPNDKNYLAVVRKHTKAPIFFIANKADKASQILSSFEKEWLRLGLGAPHPISAASGLGVGDLLDSVVDTIALPKRPDARTVADPIKVSIIGRTNVGKSSILNKILGEDRVIVSDIEHTTREPQDTLIEYKDRPFLLVDTVGIRRKSRVKLGIEREGVIRSINNIKRADIVLLVLEATMTPSKQEARLVQIALDAGSSIIIIVNKWDLVEEKQTKTPGAFEVFFRSYFPFIPWAPFYFVSALTGKRIPKILDILLEMDRARREVIPDADLQECISRLIAKQAPIWVRGRRKPRIYGLKQTDIAPPMFTLMVNDSMAIQYMYLRYVENRLRELYGFEGVPIKVITEGKAVKRSHTHTIE